MTKEIPLTKGFSALVDNDDYERLSQFKWYASESSKGMIYAVRNLRISEGGPSRMYLHRVVANAKKGEEVDHIDRNPMNNQRSNLRIVDRKANILNRGLNSSNKTGYRGVIWAKSRGVFRAEICNNRKNIFLGHFHTAEEAARAYDRAATELFGALANLNFPEESAA